MSLLGVAVFAVFFLLVVVPLGSLLVLDVLFLLSSGRWFGFTAEVFEPLARRFKRPKEDKADV